MKTILIVVLMSLTGHNDLSLLAHQSYPTMEACQAAAAKVQADPPKDVKTALYCIEEKDLTK